MPVMKLTKISRSYRNGQVIIQALRDIDLSIYESDFVSIMGPSGSGKSTMLNIIGCLDRPSSGEYEIAGKRVEK